MAGEDHIGTVARAADSAIKVFVKSQESVAALLASLAEHDNGAFVEYIEKEHGTLCYDVAIPYDKIEQFQTEMDARGVEFRIITGGRELASDQTVDKEFKRAIENGEIEKPEYVGVMYKGPKYLFDDSGRIAIDQYGQKEIVKGSDRDSIIVNRIASELNAEYIAEIGYEQKDKAHELSTLEANQMFIDDRTIKIQSPSLAKLYAIQHHANDLNIDSFISRDYDDKNRPIYQLEVSEKTANRLNDGVMSPFEQLVVDSQVALEIPQVANFVSEVDRLYKTSADILFSAREGHATTGTILSLTSNQSMEIEPTGYAHFHDRDTGEELTFDLANKEQFKDFETKIQGMDYYCGFRDAHLDSYQISEVERLRGMKKEYDEIRDVAFNSVELLNKSDVSNADFQNMAKLRPSRDSKFQWMQFGDKKDEIYEKMAEELKKRGAEKGIDIDEKQLIETLTDKDRKNQFLITKPANYEATRYVIDKHQIGLSENEITVKSLGEQTNERLAEANKSQCLESFKRARALEQSINATQNMVWDTKRELAQFDKDNPDINPDDPKRMALLSNIASGTAEINEYISERQDAYRKIMASEKVMDVGSLTDLREKLKEDAQERDAEFGETFNYRRLDLGLAKTNALQAKYRYEHKLDKLTDKREELMHRKSFIEANKNLDIDVELQDQLSGIEDNLKAIDIDIDTATKDIELIQVRIDTYTDELANEPYEFDAASYDRAANFEKDGYDFGTKESDALQFELNNFDDDIWDRTRDRDD